MAIHAGAQHISCAPALIDYERYVVNFIDVARHSFSIQAINLFVSCADDLFGPITTVRRNNRLVKTINWTAFRLSEADWELVNRVSAILGVSYIVSNMHSAEFIYERVGRQLRPANFLIQHVTHSLARDPSY